MEKGKKNGSRKSKVGRMFRMVAAEGAVLAVLAVCFLIFTSLKKEQSEEGKQHTPIQKEDNWETDNSGSDTKSEQEELRQKEEERKREMEQKRLEQVREENFNQAERLAAGYDYDAAVELLKAQDGYETDSGLQAAVQKYEAAKAECVPFGAYSSSAEVSHIFFHSLIADTSKAFDGDYDSNGYNYYMTTISEFQEMMQQMYDQGYVLVSIHDVASAAMQEDGTMVYQDGGILLPPDKKPFVLSQDDVNYYDYMDGDGFASRMVIDENGRPSTEMLMDDGTYVTGDYDLVPVLETFLEDHPDFSYRGARGLIALTGYEGTLGYRTDPASKDSPTFEQDKARVREVARVMREWGWEFACHSNGHRDMQACTDEFLVYDTENWLENVGSLVGGSDVYIFPYGIDIETTIGLYKSYKFEQLYEKGFRYYCGVFKEPWIQVRKNYVRMTRRPLDGQAMLQFPERLADLFDLAKVIDPARPELK